MKHIFLSIIISSFILLIPQNIFALEAFTPLSTNPIELISSYPDWSEIGIRTGNVIYENNTYKLWYSSINNQLKIAYATSFDGLHWEGQKLFEFTQENSFQDPSIIKVNGIYRMFFTSSENDGNFVVKSIDSQNGIDFNLNSLLEVLSSEKPWESNGVAGPLAFYENSTIYLFYSALESKWNAGLAISTNGNEYQKCNTNPFLINDVTPSSLLKYDNTYYLFFHSPNGIESIETDTLGCDSVWKNRKVILPYGFFPYVIKKGNELQMFYSTNTGGIWKINLATSQLPQNNKPVILIPGMFASWNKNALFYGTSVNRSDWLMNPIVKEYSGIEETLQNLGYQSNEDYYVFNYDWRRNLTDNATELDSYINTLGLPEKPVLIGHSLGGLIGRVYAQKYGVSKIDKVVTLGSPHQGTAQAYGAASAGETDKSDPYMWLAEKLVLQLNKDGLKTDRQIINEKLPIIQNILPTYDYLKRNGETVPIANMQLINNLLPAYNTGFESVFGSFKAVAGEKGETIQGYTVANRSVIDQLLDYYPDGRPVSSFKSAGDYTVTSLSAKAGNSPVILAKDHGELIYTKEGIGAALNAAGIEVDPDKIKEGRKTILSPSLLFLLLSPATFQVHKNGAVYEEQSGMVFIENAEEGGYSINVTGKAKGRYTLLIGQITENGDLWNRIEGEITKDPPESQSDIYQINFNKNLLQNPTQSAATLFDELILYLKSTNITLKKTDINKALANITLAKQFYAQNNKGRLKSLLLLAHQQLFQAYSKTAQKDKFKVLYATEKLEQLYEYSLDNYTNGVFKNRLQKILKDNQNLVNRSQPYLLVMKNKGKNIQKNAITLVNINSKLETAAMSFNQNSLNHAEILLKSVTELTKELLKI